MKTTLKRISKNFVSHEEVVNDFFDALDVVNIVQRNLHKQKARVFSYDICVGKGYYLVTFVIKAKHNVKL